MMKSYLLIYNDKVAAKDDMIKFIDGIDEIVNWRTDLPSTMILVSELSAAEIYARVSMLKEANGNVNGAHFLISEIGNNRQGWLPKKAWRLISDKALPE